MLFFVMVGGVTVVCFHDALDGEFAQIMIRLQTPLGAPATVQPAGLRCQVALQQQVPKEASLFEASGRIPLRCNLDRG